MSANSSLGNDILKILKIAQLGESSPSNNQKTNGKLTIDKIFEDDNNTIEFEKLKDDVYRKTKTFKIQVNLLEGQLKRREELIRKQRKLFFRELNILREELFKSKNINNYLPRDFRLENWNEEKMSNTNLSDFTGIEEFERRQVSYFQKKNELLRKIKEKNEKVQETMERLKKFEEEKTKEMQKIRDSEVMIKRTEFTLEKEKESLKEKIKKYDQKLEEFENSIEGSQNNSKIKFLKEMIEKQEDRLFRIENRIKETKKRQAESKKHAQEQAKIHRKQETEILLKYKQRQFSLQTKNQELENLIKDYETRIDTLKKEEASMKEENERIKSEGERNMKRLDEYRKKRLKAFQAATDTTSYLPKKGNNENEKKEKTPTTTQKQKEEPKVTDTTTTTAKDKKEEITTEKTRRGPNLGFKQHHQKIKREKSTLDKILLTHGNYKVVTMKTINKEVTIRDISELIATFKRTFQQYYSSIDVLTRRTEFCKLTYVADEYKARVFNFDDHDCEGKIYHTPTIVVTEVDNAAILWENNPSIMELCMNIHNKIIIGLLKECDGYILKNLSDHRFVFIFHNTINSVRFSILLQDRLIEAKWPEEILKYHQAGELKNTDRDKTVLYKGLRVRVGVNTDKPDMNEEARVFSMESMKGMIDKCLQISRLSRNGGNIMISEKTYEKICLIIGENELEKESFGDQVYIRDLGEKSFPSSSGMEDKNERIRLLYPHFLRKRKFLSALKGGISGPHNLVSKIQNLFTTGQKLEKMRLEIEKKIIEQVKIQTLEESMLEKDHLIDYLKRKILFLKDSYEKVLLENWDDFDYEKVIGQQKVIKYDVEDILLRYAMMVTEFDSARKLYEKLQKNFGVVLSRELINLDNQLYKCKNFFNFESVDFGATFQATQICESKMGSDIIEKKLLLDIKRKKEILTLRNKKIKDLRRKIKKMVDEKAEKEEQAALEVDTNNLITSSQKKPDERVEKENNEAKGEIDVAKEELETEKVKLEYLKRKVQEEDAPLSTKDELEECKLKIKNAQIFLGLKEKDLEDKIREEMKVQFEDELRSRIEKFKKMQMKQKKEFEELRDAQARLLKEKERELEEEKRKKFVQISTPIVIQNGKSNTRSETNKSKTPLQSSQQRIPKTKSKEDNEMKHEPQTQTNDTKSKATVKRDTLKPTSTNKHQDKDGTKSRIDSLRKVRSSSHKLSGTKDRNQPKSKGGKKNPTKTSTGTPGSGAGNSYILIRNGVKKNFKKIKVVDPPETDQKIKKDSKEKVELTITNTFRLKNPSKEIPPEDVNLKKTTTKPKIEKKKEKEKTKVEKVPVDPVPLTTSQRKKNLDDKKLRKRLKKLEELIRDKTMLLTKIEHEIKVKEEMKLEDKLSEIELRKIKQYEQLKKANVIREPNETYEEAIKRTTLKKGKIIKGITGTTTKDIEKNESSEAKSSEESTTKKDANVIVKSELASILNIEKFKKKEVSLKQDKRRKDKKLTNKLQEKQKPFYPKGDLKRVSSLLKRAIREAVEEKNAYQSLEWEDDLLLDVSEFETPRIIEKRILNENENNKQLSGLVDERHVKVLSKISQNSKKRKKKRKKIVSTTKKGKTTTGISTNTKKKKESPPLTKKFEVEKLDDGQQSKMKYKKIINLKTVHKNDIMKQRNHKKTRKEGKLVFEDKSDDVNRKATMQKVDSNAEMLKFLKSEFQNLSAQFFTKMSRMKKDKKRKLETREFTKRMKSRSLRNLEKMKYKDTNFYNTEPVPTVTKLDHNIPTPPKKKKKRRRKYMSYSRQLENQSKKTDLKVIIRRRVDSVGPSQNVRPSRRYRKRNSMDQRTMKRNQIKYNTLSNNKEMEKFRKIHGMLLERRFLMQKRKLLESVFNRKTFKYRLSNEK